MRVYTAALTVLLVLAGCSSPFEDMPDDELADKAYRCTITTDQSPGFAIRCDNYQRECDRRRDDGHFVC